MRYYYLNQYNLDGKFTRDAAGFRFRPEKGADYVTVPAIRGVIQEAGLHEGKPFKQGDPPKIELVVLGYDVDAQEPFQLTLSAGLHAKPKSAFLPELLDALNATTCKVSVLQPVKAAGDKFYVTRVTQSKDITKAEIVEAASNATEAFANKLQYLDKNLPEPEEVAAVPDVELDDI